VRTDPVWYVPVRNSNTLSFIAAPFTPLRPGLRGVGYGGRLGSRQSSAESRVGGYPVGKPREEEELELQEEALGGVFFGLCTNDSIVPRALGG
jgi:hypothetical protein